MRLRKYTRTLPITKQQEYRNITLTVTNNLPYPVIANIMGGITNLRDYSNATREFRWDITPEGVEFIPFIELTLDYKTNSATNFTTYTASFVNNSIGNLNLVLKLLVFELNKLGIGYFNAFTSGSQVFVNTFNNNYIFGLLTLNVSAITTESGEDILTELGDELITE